MKKTFIPLILTASLLTLSTSGCSTSSEISNPITYTDTLFDTVINVQIYDSEDFDLIDGCKELCRKYDRMFSKDDDGSEILKINNAGGTPTEVSDDTIEILNTGLYYSELSKGIFDITIGTVTSLWDFQSDEHKIPDQESINEALTHVDYQNVVISGNTVTLKDPEAKLDVGAIAKGYIADKLKEYLKGNGCNHALINLGGNVLAVGGKDDDTAFHVGIQEPFDETGEAITSVMLEDQTLVTTGIYQRYFTVDDVIYHHIIDPSTGYPSDNQLYSVTIKTDSSLNADALSTLTFLLGLDKGMELIDSLDGVEALFITSDMELIYTDQFQ